MRIAPRAIIACMLMLALTGCDAAQRAPVKPTPTATGLATGTSSASTGTTARTTTFVCANPAGSHAQYAYVGPDKSLYLVQGCQRSAPLAAEAGRRLSPIAFSPGGAWLLAHDDIADNTSTVMDFSCLTLISTATLAVTRTSLCNPNAEGPDWTRWYDVIAWDSATTFDLATTAIDSSVAVTRVTVPSLAQTTITTLKWVAVVANPDVARAGIELRGHALYYGGYQSTTEGGAYLHRYDLATGADTRFARLGLAGTGGCQILDSPCSWTGPWDLNADATKLVYHNPGPTHDITDTYIEPGQPLYVAALDGTNAQRVFPSIAPGQGFTRSQFSPDGQYVSMPIVDSFAVERLSDGQVTHAPATLNFYRWTPQPGVVACLDLSVIATTIQFYLWNAATGARTPLQTGSMDYVWA